MKCWRCTLLIAVVLLGGCYGGSIDSDLSRSAANNAEVKTGSEVKYLDGFAQ